MQDKITIADAPECLNTNDKAMWVLGYQAALAARSTCLHQIQEPAAAEQAAWHAGLDEGRAQAAPAAVAVPEETQIKALMRKHRIWIEHSTLLENDEPPRELRAVQAEQHQFEAFVQDLIALAATPAAAAPVVLPEPNFWVRPGATIHPDRGWQCWSNDGTATGAFHAATVHALLATATGLPAQAVPLKLIEAINTACGGNAWQGDALVTDLLEPACRAIASLSPLAQADARDADGMYYLQDARWSAMVGNCPSFWRLGGGYTTNLDEAERFAFKDAMRQHNCRETDLPWLCSELDKLRRPTVDCQYMPRSWDAQRESIAAIAAAKGEGQ